MNPNSPTPVGALLAAPSGLAFSFSPLKEGAASSTPTEAFLTPLWRRGRERSLRGRSLLAALLLTACAIALPAHAQTASLPNTGQTLPGTGQTAPPAVTGMGQPLPPAGDDPLGTNTTYVLSPDDQLDISVLGHTDFNASVTILPDGTFNYPLLGKVHAAGQTVDGLTTTLVHGLSSQLNQPEVTVTLKQGRPRRVSVLGDGIKAGGQFEYRAGMHLLDLLAAGGGLASEPQLVQATLVTDGGKTSTAIPLVPLLTGTDLSQNLPLAPGDLLFLIARNPEVGQVQVVGDVVKPGAYSIMPDGISVLALLNQAGGVLPTARLTTAQVLHSGQVRIINLRPLLTTDLTSQAGQTRLVPGDVLLVPSNKNRILALGEVRTPGVVPIPDDQPLTLTTAYALVGGATPDGDTKNVDIIRRDGTGKATLMAVNIQDLLKGKNGITDLTLQPNDILFIQTRNHPQNLGNILSTVGGLGAIVSLSRL